jgi:hypothetical protein
MVMTPLVVVMNEIENDTRENEHHDEKQGVELDQSC